MYTRTQLTRRPYAGGISIFPIMTRRAANAGGIKDPCGNIWWIATHVEDVPPEERDDGGIPDAIGAN
jgi:hypothetical protein